MSEKIYQVSQVISNPLLVEKIIFHAQRTNSYMENIRLTLKMRLVSQTFNDACLAVYRKEYLNFHASDMVGDWMEPEPGEVRDITFNTCIISLLKVESFFGFLHNIAKVRISKIHLQHLWTDFGVASEKEKFHNDIYDILIGQNQRHVKVMRGMEEICRYGCARCGEMAVRCREFGPLQLNVLLNHINDAVHFEVLRISDFLLCTIAQHCVNQSASKNECLEKMRQMINRKITCDTLVLELFEKPPLSLCGPEVHNENRSIRLPLDILREMQLVWKPRRVRLQFTVGTRKGQVTPEDWCRAGYFEVIRFEETFDATSLFHSTHPLECVEIETFLRFCHIHREMGGLTKNPTNDCYSNLISNVRKSFRCSKIIIEFPEFTDIIFAHTFDRFTSSILSSVEKYQQNDLDVTICVFVRCYDTRWLRRWYRQDHDEAVRQGKAIAPPTPDIFGAGARLVNAEMLNEHWQLMDVIDREPRRAEHCSKVFCLQKIDENLSLKLEVNVLRFELSTFFKERNSLENTGFLRHFWDCWRNGH